MVRRDRSPSYEVSSILVSLTLVLVLLAILLTVGIARARVLYTVPRVDLTGLIARAGTGPHVRESLEGGAGEVLRGDCPYHGLGCSGQRDQGRLDGGGGGGAGRVGGRGTSQLEALGSD